MSRSGYSDDCDGWDLIRWRGAVASAIRGKRGQAFLREALAALDALPEKRLVSNDLVVVDGDDDLAEETNVCLLGAVGLGRRLDLRGIDPEDREKVAGIFGIPYSFACEIMHENDEHFSWDIEQRRSVPETPEQRFMRMRRWIEASLSSGTRPMLPANRRKRDVRRSHK